MGSTKKLSVENALREVQRLIREHDPRGDELPIGTRNVDVPGTEPPKVYCSFFADESEAVDRAAAALVRTSGSSISTTRRSPRGSSRTKRVTG